MKHDQALRRILAVTRREECNEAEEFPYAWMQENSKDFGMLDAGEQLAMMSEKHGEKTYAESGASGG